MEVVNFVELRKSILEIVPCDYIAISVEFSQLENDIVQVQIRCYLNEDGFGWTEAPSPSSLIEEIKRKKLGQVPMVDYPTEVKDTL